MEELSRRFHVSRERVRKLEVCAFEKMQKAVMVQAKQQHMATVDKAREWTRA